MYDLPISNLSKKCGSYVLVDSSFALHNLRKEKMQSWSFLAWSNKTSRFTCNYLPCLIEVTGVQVWWTLERENFLKLKVLSAMRPASGPHSGSLTFWPSAGCVGWRCFWFWGGESEWKPAQGRFGKRNPSKWQFWGCEPRNGGNLWEIALQYTVYTV